MSMSQQKQCMKEKSETPISITRMVPKPGDNDQISHTILFFPLIFTAAPPDPEGPEREA